MHHTIIGILQLVSWKKHTVSYHSQHLIAYVAIKRSKLQLDIYIYIFRFWFYNHASSFPKDKTEAVFFFDLAGNTGDGFSHIILPVVHYTDITLWRNPVIIIRSMARHCKITCPYTLSFIDIINGFQFFIIHGAEIFGTEDTEPSLHPTNVPLLDNSNTAHILIVPTHVL